MPDATQGGQALGAVVDASTFVHATRRNPRTDQRRNAVACLDAMLTTGIHLERWREVDAQFRPSDLGPDSELELVEFLSVWRSAMEEAGLARPGPLEQLESVPPNPHLRGAIERFPDRDAARELEADAHLVEAALAGSGRLLTGDRKLLNIWAALRRGVHDTPRFLAGSTLEGATVTWIQRRMPDEEPYRR